MTVWHIRTGKWIRDQQGLVTKPMVRCGRDYDFRTVARRHSESDAMVAVIGTEGVTSSDFVTPSVEKYICPECLSAMKRGIIVPGDDLAPF